MNMTVETTELDTFLATLREQVQSNKITLDQLRWFAGLDGDKRKKLVLPQAVEVQQVSASILRCISEDAEIVIPATEGKRTIGDAKETFLAGIDADFKNWGANKSCGARLAIPVKVHEMAKDATFSQMFSSLGEEKTKFSFTHDQIITFCEKHRQWLRTDGYGTFFLFESESNFFVAYVRFDDHGRLSVFVLRFEYSSVWRAGRRHRLFVPQL